jgi:hypothetical protein
MKRSSSLKRRVKEIETARGVGSVNLIFSDGSKESFNFSRNECLQVLLASFDIAHAARNPAAQPGSTSRAIAVAKQIGKAEQVTPHSRLWDTVAGIVREAEKEQRDCTTHAPDPASDSVFENAG